MKNEFRFFFAAINFYTRLPSPSWIDHSPEHLEKSTRYLPLIGIIIGAIGGIVYWLASLIFPHSISVLMSMLATIWATGAFHEDGLADMFDGFGGGLNKEQILSIMKDSRIGTFGVVGLTGILGLKFLSLNEVRPVMIPLILVAGHSLSRFMAVTLSITHGYAREDSSAKAKPATGSLSITSLMVSGIFGLIPLVFFYNPKIFLALIPVIGVRWYLGRILRKRIDGFTGDCSGAVQQLTEVVFYLGVLVI